MCRTPKDLSDAESKKHKKGLCIVKYCGNCRMTGYRYCGKHKTRKFREQNPITAAFLNLRSNAKRRGKEFMLTLPQFKEFCDQYNYIELKGKSSLSLQVDRIDEYGPYSIENIQGITLRENVQKMHLSKKFDSSEVPF